MTEPNRCTGEVEDHWAFTQWEVHMRVLKIILTATTLGLCFSMSALGAQLVEAKQDGVKVLKDASKGAGEVGTLNKGQTAEALDRKGMYWRVKLSGGQEGFVSFTAVNRKAGEASALSEAISAAAKDSRDMDGTKSARTRSAVMGVRGLDESAETGSAGNVSPNLRMVYAMEDRVISKKRIEKLNELVQTEIQGRMNMKTKTE